MHDSRPRPLDANLQLSRSAGNLQPEILESYQELVGALLYLANCTFPDISHAVGMLARFMSAPTDEHYRVAKQVRRYLVEFVDLGNQYAANGTKLVGYSDADYAGDPDKRKSTLGHVYIEQWSRLMEVQVTADSCCIHVRSRIHRRSRRRKGRAVAQDGAR
jgi:hypothetical protein